MYIPYLLNSYVALSSEVGILEGELRLGDLYRSAKDFLKLLQANKATFILSINETLHRVTEVLRKCESLLYFMGKQTAKYSYGAVVEFFPRLPCRDGTEPLFLELERVEFSPSNSNRTELSNS